MFSILSHHGVLGMNARNLLYIKPFNPRKAVALADDKLKTKAFLAARGIPVAKIYARIDSHSQLRTWNSSSLPDQCVLKPTHGFGGEGIMVLKGRRKGEFLEQGKHPISEQRLHEHIEDILDGKFSLNGLPDTAFFERLLVADPFFAPFRPAGLPDLRIVVFNLVPVMAMLRVPTAASHGKANMHQGGIGIGIDLAKGTTTHAVQYGRIISQLSHGTPVAGHAIPGWEELLSIASRIQYITNIGYLAVDLTIDAEQGPVLLEVNARAGLQVQVANLAPLRSRLERVAGLRVATPDKGVELAQQLFGQKWHGRVREMSDTRPVLGIRETLTIAGVGTSIEVPALIAPDQERSSIAPELLEKLLSADAAEETDEGLYRVKCTLGGRKIQTVVRVEQMPSASVRAVVGRRDLSGFLLDPSKAAAAPLVRSKQKDDERAIDKLLSQADQELMLLPLIKPQNLRQEWKRAEEDISYNPVFRYRPIGADLDEWEARLEALSPDDSPMGILLRKKRGELLQRISLLRHRGDARRFTEASASLFGLPTSDLITSATLQLRQRTACDMQPLAKEMQTAVQVAAVFEQVLASYGLHDWQVHVRERMVARCTVGGKGVYLRADALFSQPNIDALIAHEIETHVLTAENGAHQPYALFRRGCAQYLDTQEGLAIYSQNRILPPHHDKRFGAARNILAAAFALDHSFTDTRRYLHEELNYSREKSLSKAIELKRGLTQTAEPGAFTKAIVYFRGLQAVEQYIASGGSIEQLYLGKIALEDLPLIQRITGIKPPLLIPMHLRPVPPATKRRTKKKA